MATQRKVEDLYPRAPRYVIEVGDNPIVRFAHMPKGSKSMHTRIVDLSETGMAFLTPFLHAPKVEEEIKIEFHPPNTAPIACYAKVVRVQTHRTYNPKREPQIFKLVAVEYKELHPKQRKMLAEGLYLQILKKQQDFSRKQLLLKMQWLAVHSFARLKKIIANLFKSRN